MKQILKQFHNYLRRKMKELQPDFISITVWVPDDIYRDLVDEYESRDVSGRAIVSFVEGEWPDETVLNFTPTEEE